MQMTAKHKVATPVNWKDGDDVIILGLGHGRRGEAKYPQGWKAPKPYLRIVPAAQVMFRHIFLDWTRDLRPERDCGRPAGRPQSSRRVAAMARKRVVTAPPGLLCSGHLAGQTET
jgi:hypothetical protein